MKVLFIDTVHPVLKDRLLEKGIACDEDYTSGAEDILTKIHEYDGLVIRSRFKIDEKFLSKAKNLRFIARSGSGLENIDLIAAEKYDVRIISSPEGNKDAVAEHAIGMILSLFNNLNRADAQVRKGVWDREGNRGLELRGMTVGIIGYGVMGSAFAERLMGFGCKVVAHDKYKSNFGSENIEELSLDELKKQADIISLHLPYSEETHYYIDADFINSCSRDFYLINTARGQHVCLDDLVEGLKSGKVKGACLDVLEYEKSSFENLREDEFPPSWNHLKKLDTVIFSPHVAGWTFQSYEKLSTVLANKICDFLGL